VSVELKSLRLMKGLQGGARGGVLCTPLRRARDLAKRNEAQPRAAGTWRSACPDCLKQRSQALRNKKPKEKLKSHFGLMGDEEDVDHEVGGEMREGGGPKAVGAVEPAEK